MKMDGLNNRLFDKYKKSKKSGDLLFVDGVNLDIEWIKKQKDAIFFISDDNTFLDCNSVTLNLFGYDCCCDFMGIHPGLISPEYQSDGRLSVEKADEMMRLAKENGSHQFKWTHKRKDGKLFECEVLLLKILYNNKKNVGLFAKVIDTSKQIELLNKLKYHERNSDFIFQNMFDAFALHEIIFDENDVPVDYRYIFVNDEFEKQTGFKKEEVVGKTVKEVIPDIHEDNFNWIDEYAKVALTGVPKNFKNYSKFLNRWYDVNVYSPEKNYFVTIFSDITFEIEHDKCVERKKIQLREIIDQAPNGIIIFDKTGKVLKINRKFMDFFGLRDVSLEFPDININNLNNFKNFKLKKFVKDLLDENVNFKEVFKIRHLIKNKSDNWYNIKGYNTIGPDGTYINTVILFSDITEMINFENELKSGEQVLNSYYDLLPEGLYELDNNFNVIKVNDSFCELFKMNKSEIVGKDLCELFSPGSQIEECKIKMKKRVENRDINTTTFKLLLNNKEDNELLIEMSSILKWGGEDNNELFGSYGVIRDISEIKDSYKIQKKNLEEMKERIDKNLEILKLEKSILNDSCG